MSLDRIVKVTRRKVEYYEEEVNLLDHLKANVAEIYLSHENKCVEIRFPTRTDNYTHYVAHVPFAAINDLNGVLDDIKNERHMDFLTEHVNDIVWARGFSNTVTK